MSYLINTATIFICCTLLICARGMAQEGDFLTPDQIDYSGAPGYQREDGRSLEWSETSLREDGVRITASLKPAAGLRLRWLGTAGYEISDDDTTLLIEYRGVRLYFTETPVVVDPAIVGRVDILIQGIAARNPDDTIARTVAHLLPIFVIPTHYDNFFRPVSSLRSFDYDLGVRLRITLSRI